MARAGAHGWCGARPRMAHGEGRGSQCARLIDLMLCYAVECRGHLLCLPACLPCLQLTRVLCDSVSRRIHLTLLYSARTQSPSDPDGALLARSRSPSRDTGVPAPCPPVPWRRAWDTHILARAQCSCARRGRIARWPGARWVHAAAAARAAGGDHLCCSRARA